MDGDWKKIEIKRLERNEQGSDAHQISISLPADTEKYIREWAKRHNVTVSRAVHNHIWMAYHAERGDFKQFYEAERQ